MGNRIKVLIVDDSALVRESLHKILASDPDIEVIDTASDPYVAVKKMQKNAPDVLTLDIEMPKMDGLTFLQKIMAQYPIPVVVISTLTEKGTESALKALEFGAVEVMAKPKVNTREMLHESALQIIQAIKSAAQAKVSRTKIGNRRAPVTGESGDVAVAPPIPGKSHFKADQIIAVGASTGGTEAIRHFLERMPSDCPGIVIVQHMPEIFTKQFAKRLNEQCGIRVKEAENNDPVEAGTALIAPGNKHMMLHRIGHRYSVKTKDGPLVNRHKPSVDVLFRSVARYAGNKAVGVILTGMGGDGAKGLLEMKEAGAVTIAQDEQSSIVFGMPKEAIKLGAVEYVVSLNNIAVKVLQISSHIYR